MVPKAGAKSKTEICFNFRRNLITKGTYKTNVTKMLKCDQYSLLVFMLFNKFEMHYFTRDDTLTFYCCFADI
jgi:hypothetical protein